MYTCSRCGSVLPQSVECLCPPDYIHKAVRILEKKSQEAAERAGMKEPKEFAGAIHPIQSEVYLTIAKALRGEE